MNKRINIILDDEEDYEDVDYDYEDDDFDISYESAMEP